MSVAIIDYGMGNLRSVQKAFEKVGAQAVITRLPADIVKADKVVLPGVGAMGPAMQKLHELGLSDVIHRVAREGKSLLGICLGLQLLFDKSCEGGYVDGLKILRGTVLRLAQGKVPHMGWNQLAIQPAGNKLFNGVANGENVYFCHSYVVCPAEQSIVAAQTEYGSQFVSAVVSGNIWGVQFHPEKSQTVGLHILRNFVQS